MNKKLELILKYKMTTQEALSFKVALLWEEIIYKEFPGLQFVKLRKKGDPRKSVLFKYCYKLVRETAGTLPPNEYRFYVLAQVQIMGRMSSGEVHAMIDPAILTGPRAWKRWRWWKARFDKNMKLMNKNIEELKIQPAIENLRTELQNTKKFLDKQEGELKDWLKTRKLHEWLAADKISPYFFILSPLVAECLEGKILNEVIGRDLSVFQITDEIRNLFKEIF